MTLHLRGNRVIRTSFDYPPIPCRDFDWSAVDDNTYDMTDTDEDGSPYSTHPVGHGATEAAAIDDLLQQLEDADGADLADFGADDSGAQVHVLDEVM